MISINLTIHNKDFLIEKVLESIINNTVLPYELIIVLDGCTDKSEEKTYNFLKKTKVKYKIYYTNNVFETKANNVAANNSENDIIIIIQDDMVINEHGWDKRIIKPLKEFNDVISVTANASHDFIYNINNNCEKLDSNYLGYSDIIYPVNIVNKKTNPSRETFVIRSTSNRGPLAINHIDFKKLNYFDEIFSPLEMDDHDLHYRAYTQLGKVTGLYWIDYISEENWGGTRINGHQPWFLKSVHKNQKIIINRHIEQINKNRSGEIRQLK